ncbi:MAG: DUF2147 domain-containing protein [Candidatus Eisenbacteria bacterium]|uniref:DUF2147 domain-containing protein n=1 Tax=Eiseniibacteriota bacterium TaxID=2212470 RepID=A0A948RWC1_UNCEI|nr:DUF2147 domain-containing protein [Candidatus Eisenbacteria bacterium]MBU1949068.1 DUF2147 domain-containing protein [Candidatus Eisenbacteria bacterium]MBU2691171.1 DUF2147 domain-containing protein [Candidatus Eisenbacteria bacterium]
MTTSLTILLFTRRSLPSHAALRRCVFIILLVIVPVLLTASMPDRVSAGDDPIFEPHAILGIWETEHQEDRWSHVEVYESDGKICGRIIWLNKPDYVEDDPEGTLGMPLVDLHNPDESLRDRPLIGLEMMRDFVHDGKNKWVDGRIYDPKNGKTYRCKLTLEDENRLELFGYVKVGFVKLGRNTTWVRVADNE